VCRKPFVTPSGLTHSGIENINAAVDTTLLSTCLEGGHPAYRLVPGRAILLGERSVFAISTKSCKLAWSYSTRSFAVLSMQLGDKWLHLSGMEIGNGEPLETWADLDLATGKELAGSIPKRPVQPSPAWQVSPWVPARDIVGFASGEGPPRGLDQRRAPAGRPVAADPEPHPPAAASVDAGNGGLPGPAP